MKVLERSGARARSGTKKKRCNADQRLRGWHPCISKYSKFASIFYFFFLFSYVFYLSEYVTHSPTHPLPERIIQQHRRQESIIRLLHRDWQGVIYYSVRHVSSYKSTTAVIPNLAREPDLLAAWNLLTQTSTYHISLISLLVKKLAPLLSTWSVPSAPHLLHFLQIPLIKPFSPAILSIHTITHQKLPHITRNHGHQDLLRCLLGRPCLGLTFARDQTWVVVFPSPAVSSSCTTPFLAETKRIKPRSQSSFSLPASTKKEKK